MIKCLLEITCVRFQQRASLRAKTLLFQRDLQVTFFDVKPVKKQKWTLALFLDFSPSAAFTSLELSQGRIDADTPAFSFCRLVNSPNRFVILNLVSQFEVIRPVVLKIYAGQSLLRLTFEIFHLFGDRRIPKTLERDLMTRIFIRSVFTLQNTAA